MHFLRKVFIRLRTIQVDPIVLMHFGLAGAGIYEKYLYVCRYPREPGSPYSIGPVLVFWAGQYTNDDLEIY